MNAPPSFGKSLKQRRMALDLTQEELARQVGCTVSALYKIESGARRPSRQIATLLAQHLRIPADRHDDFIRFARGDVTASLTQWADLFHTPTNLPVPPTPLIGRESEIAAMRVRLLHPETRLLTLVGPPGVGKTRLALQVAADMVNDFPDGVFFVALAPISDATLLCPTIASALGAPEMGARAAPQRLHAHLRDRNLLLVLDNFEQILDAAAQVAEILNACPWVKAIVTSRAPLRIRRERQHPVPPLALPREESLTDLRAVSRAPAVTLFAERAQTVAPDFALTVQSAPAVARICARLDGLPLAIELISARVKMLPPQSLLERLRGDLLLHSDGLRDIEPRHRTLHNAIAWSYHLLTSDEQTLFRRLGVLVGGWTLEASAAVCMDGIALSALDGTTSLLDKNLVKREDADSSEPRFTMLETLREYALDRLVASGELERMQEVHAAWTLALVETIQTHEPALTQQQHWNLLETEHPNLRAALHWSLNEPSGETQLRLASALCSFWGRRGHLSEGIDWLNEAVARSAQVTDPTLRGMRAEMLGELGVYNQWQGELDQAQKHAGEATAIYRELGDLRGVAEMLADSGMISVLRGDAEGAALLLADSMALYQNLNDRGGVALCQFFLGNVAFLREDWRQVAALWETSLATWRDMGVQWYIAVLLANLGMIAIELGELGRARAALVESLALSRTLDEKWQTIQALEHFGRLAVEEAQAAQDGARDLAKAAQLFGAAEGLREQYGVNLFSLHLRDHLRRIDALHARLDAATLSSAWAACRAMTLDQAIDFALAE